MNKKINLIFFHPYSAIGGADNSLFRLIGGLNLKKYNISFITLNMSFLKAKLPGVKFIEIKSSRSLFAIFKLRNEIKKLIKNNFYEKNILISNQNYANILAFLSSFKIKNLKKIFIERNHTDELFFEKEIFRFTKNMLIYFLMKLIYPKIDRIVAISKGLEKNLKTITPASKIDLIYNPAFDKQIINLSKKKINYKFKKKFKYIICVSRFTKRKGIQELIISFCKALKINKNLKLILVGYGDEEKNIINLIQQKELQKNVKIIKKCKNPYPYIKKSHLFILNSKYEGFGNVLVESIILNTPVISTNCNSGPSEILLNGKGGDLIKVYDNSKILTSKILQFFNNPISLIQKTKFAKKKVNRFSKINNLIKFKQLFSSI